MKPDRPRVLFLENFDSFSYNLIDYLERAGAHCVVHSHTESIDIVLGNKHYDGLVLSPGPGVPATSGNMMEILGLLAEKIPILGICLGHQAIVQHFGGQLVPALKPMFGKTDNLYLFDRDIIFSNFTHMQVVRYHAWVTHTELTPLKTLAVSEKTGEIMAVKHAALPVYGLQFHPEAWLTTQGSTLINNWVALLRV